MTDAEALQILQGFAHAKPVRLQQAVSHIEARMLTLAQLAELLREPCTRCLAPMPLRHAEALPDYTFPVYDTGAAAAPEDAKAFALSADATSDATPPASPGSRFDAGAG